MDLYGHVPVKLLDRLIIQIVNLKDQKVVLLITMEVKMIYRLADDNKAYLCIKLLIVVVVQNFGN